MHTDLTGPPPSPPLPYPTAPALRPPAGPGVLLRTVANWAGHRPWLALLALAAVVAWLVGAGALHRWRERRLIRGAQQLIITAPPVVEPAGAVQFWATVYGSVYRVWWRRLLAG